MFIMGDKSQAPAFHPDHVIMYLLLGASAFILVVYGVLQYGWEVQR